MRRECETIGIDLAGVAHGCDGGLDDVDATFVRTCCSGQLRKLSRPAFRGHLRDRADACADCVAVLDRRACPVGAEGDGADA